MYMRDSAVHILQILPWLSRIEQTRAWRWCQVPSGCVNWPVTPVGMHVGHCQRASVIQSQHITPSFLTRHGWARRLARAGQVLAVASWHQSRTSTARRVPQTRDVQPRQALNSLHERNETLRSGCWPLTCTSHISSPASVSLSQ